jgi:hypothetical protein
VRARVTNIRPAGNSSAATPTLRTWVPLGRRLVLVDIENLVGGSGITAASVSNALDSLRTAIGQSDHDVWTTACGPTLLSTAMSVFSTGVLLGWGENGADNRLLEFLEPDVVVGRYSSVVLASGDSAAFAAPVRELAALGVPTDVYLGAGYIGADLYRAARSVIATGPNPLRTAA